MKILVDECIDRRLANCIVGHEVVTAHAMGWAGTKNGELLKLAIEADFQVFVTADRNLSFQQNVSKFPLAIIVLGAPDNRLATLKLLVPDLLAALETARPGAVTIVPVA